MEFDPAFLSRIQFAFTISFHIIFPSFTIGLAAWLATMEAVHLATGNALYRRLFDFWLKVFAVSFGMGVVSGIVMAFEFGTNWSVLAEKTGSIQGSKAFGLKPANRFRHLPTRLASWLGGPQDG
jgi:cytochrome bd ubiquinol oxidase subunit I